MTARFHLRRRSAFTLLELILAMSVFAVIMLAIAASMSTMQNLWMKMRGKADQFRNARAALHHLQTRLTRATLMSRLAPDTSNASSSTGWVRDSDLHFVCGPVSQLMTAGRPVGSAVFFQGPFGEPSTSPVSLTALPSDLLDETLSAWGYFVEYRAEETERPAFMRDGATPPEPRRRFRLLEFRQPADELTLFKPDESSRNDRPAIQTAGSTDGLYRWFREPLSQNDPRLRHTAVVAENILAAIIMPYDPQPDGSSEDASAPDGVYDSRRFQYEPESPAAKASRHRLPPALRIAVVALDEDYWLSLGGARADSLAAELSSMINARFHTPSRFGDDLRTLGNALDQAKVRYRISTLYLPLSEQ